MAGSVVCQEGFVAKYVQAKINKFLDPITIEECSSITYSVNSLTNRVKLVDIKFGDMVLVIVDIPMSAFPKEPTTKELGQNVIAVIRIKIPEANVPPVIQ